MPIGRDATEQWLLTNTGNPRRGRMAGALIVSFVVHAGLSGPLFSLLYQTPPAPVEHVLSVYFPSIEQETGEEEAIRLPPQNKSIAPAISEPPPQPVTSLAPRQVKPKPVITSVPKIESKIPPILKELEETTTTAAPVSVLPSPPVLPSTAVKADAQQVERNSSKVAPAPLEARIRPIYSPQPEYPRLALRLGLEGHVLLKVWVSGEGVPSVIVVLESSGYESLDNSAKQGVQHWRFEIHDNAEGGWVNLPVTFRLK